MNYLTQRQRQMSCNITQGGLLAIQQSVTQEQSRNGSTTQRFVPFIKERDSMNRLVSKLQSISPERCEKKKEIIIQDKWKQSVKTKSPLKIVRSQSKLMSKQRSFSNADFKQKLIQVVQVQTDRVDESIQHIEEQHNNSIIQQSNTQRSPIKLRQLKQNSYHSDNRQQFQQQIIEKRIQNNDFRQCDIKLPALLLKQYVKDLLDGNKKIKDATIEERKYEFPIEFEQKIIQMKREVRKMKTKLKNWENDKRTSDDLKHLKEVAQSIIAK